MFFSKKYKIIVSNSCHENWDKMLPTEKGRFCNSCAKSVVDYTRMSDTQINEILRNASGNMCGRFTNEQLEKNYTVKPQLQLSAQRRFFQYLISILLTSKAFVNRVIAQDTLKTEQTDSFTLIAVKDSSIVDTAAMAIEDTAKLNPTFCSPASVESIWEWMNDSPVIIFNDSSFTSESMFVLGGFGIVYEPTVCTTWDPPKPIISPFDSIGKVKKVIQKITTVVQNNNPASQKPKRPVKKEEPITGILPEELKRKSEQGI